MCRKHELINALLVKRGCSTHFKNVFLHHFKNMGSQFVRIAKVCNKYRNMCICNYFPGKIFTLSICPSLLFIHLIQNWKSKINKDKKTELNLCIAGVVWGSKCTFLVSQLIKDVLDDRPSQDPFSSHPLLHGLSVYIFYTYLSTIQVCQREETLVLHLVYFKIYNRTLKIHWNLKWDRFD